MDQELIFFDCDGTLSVPVYDHEGKWVIGFPEVQQWIDYCAEHGEDTYKDCPPVGPVKRYAEKKKAEGAKLYVITCTLSEIEVRAKEKFIARVYPGLFEEIYAVYSDDDKIKVIREVAEREGVPLDHCELVEDTFRTLLHILADGVRPMHISQIVGEL